MRLGRSVAVRDIADVTAQDIVGLITGALPADVPTPEDTETLVS
jgi:fructose transport system ATP-binding protein